MLSYERFIPDTAPDFESALIATVDHVRGHLSSCVDPDDDDCALDNDVTIEYRRVDPEGSSDGGTMVVGTLDADPTDDYPLDALPVEPVDGEEVIS